MPFLAVALLASASPLAAERPRLGVVPVVDRRSADTGHTLAAVFR